MQKFKNALRRKLRISYTNPLSELLLNSCFILDPQSGVLSGSSSWRVLLFQHILKTTQPAITSSKLTIETVEEGVKYVQS